MEATPPMRTVWRGVVTFGMVVLPVRLVAATEEHRGRFREIHSVDGGRIRHKRVCEVDGPQEEIPYGDVGRAVELPDGGLVPVTDEDLKRLPLPTRHVAGVLGFVPGSDIDPISYGRAYYAAPDGAAADRPYVLLTEALARTGYVGLCKIALRQRERLAVLRPRHGVIVLQGSDCGPAPYPTAGSGRAAGVPWPRSASWMRPRCNWERPARSGAHFCPGAARQSGQVRAWAFSRTAVGTARLMPSSSPRPSLRADEAGGVAYGLGRGGHCLPALNTAAEGPLPCPAFPGRSVHGTGKVWVSHSVATSRWTMKARSSRDSSGQPIPPQSCVIEGPWPCSARQVAANSAARGPRSGCVYFHAAYAVRTFGMTCMDRPCCRNARATRSRGSAHSGQCSTASA
jgi:Ku70/Ku80-like protein